MKRGKENITLGSGNLMVKEFNDTLPAYTDFDPSTDLLGHISGGATLEYEGTWYEAKDDSGRVTKTLMTDETSTLKSGLITWNGETLARLISTARVTEADGIRIVLIGGISNQNNKSYAFCFHHEDPIDGDLWVIIRAVNQGALSLAFAKDKETVADVELKALAQDDSGTLIQLIEELDATNTAAEGADA